MHKWIILAEEAAQMGVFSPEENEYSAIKIEKNIPVPITGNLRADLLRKMKKGDSIFVNKEGTKIRKNWRTSARFIGFQAVVREEGKGFRLWHNGKIKDKK